MYTICISDASYRTIRAVLYYLYTEYIVFAPPSSYYSSKQSRTDTIQGYLRRDPMCPVPVSPKSVYAVAHKYEIPVLQALALDHFDRHITHANVFTELFGTTCRLYTEPREKVIAFAVRNWRSLCERKEWKETVEEAKSKPDGYFIEIMSRFLTSLQKPTPILESSDSSSSESSS